MFLNRCRPARCGGLLRTTTARQFIVIEPRAVHASYSDVTCDAPHGWMLIQLCICIMNDNTSTVVEKSEGRKEDIVPFSFAERRHHFNLVCFRWLGHMRSKAATNFSFALVVMLLNLHERVALEVKPLSDARFRLFCMCSVEWLLASPFPPARMYEPGFHRTHFREFLYWELLRKSVEKRRTLLNLDNSIEHLPWRQYNDIVDSSTKYFFSCTTVQREPILVFPW